MFREGQTGEHQPEFQNEAQNENTGSIEVEVKKYSSNDISERLFKREQAIKGETEFADEGKDLESELPEMCKFLEGEFLSAEKKDDQEYALVVMNRIHDMFGGDSPVVIIISRNWEHIKKMADEEDPVGRKIMLRCAITMLEGVGELDEVLDGNKEMAETVQRQAEQVLPNMMAFAEQDLHNKPAMEMLATFYKYGSGKGRESIHQWVDKLAEDNPGKEILKQQKLIEILLKKGILSSKYPDKDLAPLIEHILETYGGSLEHVKVWADNCDEEKGKDGVVEYALENMSAMAFLERSKKGSVKELEKEFGIVNFARYSPEFLLKQLEQKDEQLPYGIMVFPKTDWNEAFRGVKIGKGPYWSGTTEHRQQGSNLWQGIDKSLSDLEKSGDKMAVRVFEVGSLMDLTKRLARMDKKYGSQNKISFAMLSGHGSKESICLSNRGKEFKKNDLSGRGAKRAGKFFTKDADIVFNSCSTGNERGIAQQTATVLGLRVIAPTNPDSVGKLEAFKNEKGKIKLRAEYYEEKNPPSYQPEEEDKADVNL